MRHKALAAHPGILVSCLIATSFLGSARAGAAGTRLIFPDLIQAEGVDVGYAVLNPLGETAEVTFSAYGVGGALLDGPGVTNPVTLDVGPRSQLARFPADLFGFALDSQVTGWMEVTSDSEEIKGFFITLEDGLDRIDGADATTNTSTSFILPFPPGADPAAGIVHLVNAGEASANTTVELLSGTGAVLDDTNRLIPAHGKLQSSPSDLVPEIEGQDSVYLKVTSDQPVAAYQSFRVGDSIAGLNGIIAADVDVLYSPQLGTGPVINSLLQLVNAGNEDETLTLTARDEAGALLADAGRSPQGEASNPRQIELAAGELFQSDMAAFFGIPVDELRSGWIEVRHPSEEPIFVVGSILFGDSAGGAFNASLPLQSEARLIHLYSHVADGTFGAITWFTGLATLNTTDKDANVSVTVRAPGGQVTANGGYLLGAGERVSKTLPEILPGFGPQAGGSIEVVSDVEIFSFSLFALSDLSVLAAIPTQPFESIIVLDGTEAVGGVIQEPAIRIPEGVVLNPDGPLELIGEQSVIVDGDIVSDSSITIRSPGGTVLIGGRIDTRGGEEPGAAGIFKNGQKLQGKGEEPNSTDITIEGQTVAFAGVTIDDPGSVEDPDAIGPFVASGTPAAVGAHGGDISVLAEVFVIVNNALAMVAGDGRPGQGSFHFGSRTHSGHGGDIDFKAKVVLKASGNNETLLLLKAGDGGQKGDPKDIELCFSASRSAFAPNGGNGGTVDFAIEESTVEKFVLLGGRGRGGQCAISAGESSGDEAESHGGTGGNGGDMDAVIEPEQSEGQSLLASAEILVVGRVFDGGPGGDAIAFPSDGGPAENGGDGTARAGDGGKAGLFPGEIGPDSFTVAGTPVFFFDKRLGDPNPDGGDAYVGSVFFSGVEGGNGGNSTSPGKNGGKGGDMEAIAGEAKEDHASDGDATVNEAANGGHGFNGCPNQNGSNGGDGGGSKTEGNDETIDDTGNGGNGGNGNQEPGKGGKLGQWNRFQPAGSSLQGNDKPDNSLNRGVDGGDCPTEGLPVGSGSFTGRKVGGVPDEVIELVQRNGKKVRAFLNSPQLSLSLLLENKDTKEAFLFSAFDPDFPDEPPYNAIGEIVVPAGKYCLKLFYSVGGVSFLRSVHQFEVPVTGTATAQFGGGDLSVIHGEEDVIVINVDLTECCDPGPLSDVSGTIDNPNGGFVVTSMQFFDPIQQIFAGGLLDFPGSPGLPLGGLAGGSQGTYTGSLPDGTYDVRIRGNPTDARSRFLQTFAAALNVSEQPVETNFQLPQLTSIDVTVTAENFRSIFFRQAGIEVQGLNPEVSTLVPAGELDVEVRRRVRDGDGFTLGELLWAAGQLVLPSPPALRDPPARCSTRSREIHPLYLSRFWFATSSGTGSKMRLSPTGAVPLTPLRT